MKTIIVGYDETDAAKRALERSAEIAKAFGSELIVTSVAGMAPAGPRGGGVDPVESPDKHREELARAQEALSALGITAELVPAVGDVAEAIVDLADQRGADLIVVGTREPGMLERLLGHSVSGAVTRHAHCDVLIVH